MQLPPQASDTMFDALLQALPPAVEQLARDYKAFQRARKIKTPAQLLRMVFLYSGLDKSLRDVAGEMTLLVERLTDSSVRERLEACGPWIHARLAAMLTPASLPVLPGSWRLLVVDGTQVQAPGATGTDYRIHVCLDVRQARFVHIVPTDAHTGESLAHFPLGRGDLVLADRHYATANSIVATVARQADVVLRMSAQRLPLYGPEGTRVDLLHVLQDQPHGTTRTVTVQVRASHPQGTVAGYVHAYRLDEEAANRARQRLRERSKKRGHRLKELTLQLAEWVLVFTTVPPAQLSAPTVLALYRVRWQVELAIKRWKSLLDVDALRARAGSPLATVWLSGKLLYAVLVEQRAQRKMGTTWAQLDGDRYVTWWRVWKLVKDEVDMCILSVADRRYTRWNEGLAVLAERPRRRRLQRLPEEMRGCTHGGHEASQETMPIAA